MRPLSPPIVGGPPAHAARLLKPTRRPLIDLCFIDAQHSYEGVKEDYAEFAPHCRSAMFHDIQDMSTWHLGNNSGGVPAFWDHLTSSVRPHRVTAITFQLATAQRKEENRAKSLKRCSQL